MVKVSNAKDLLMLLLYAKGHKGEQCEPIRGRTRIMKMVFLFEKEVLKQFNLNKVFDGEALPDFTAYNFGPFSAQVFADLEFLVDTEFVEVIPVVEQGIRIEAAIEEHEYWQAGSGTSPDIVGPEKEEDFRLTELGKSFVKDDQAGKLSKEQWAMLDEFKARCTGAPLRALLRYVYSKYPKFTTESKILHDILSD